MLWLCYDHMFSDNKAISKKYVIWISAPGKNEPEMKSEIDHDLQLI